MQVLDNKRPQPIVGVAFDRSGKILLAGGSGTFALWNLAQRTAELIVTKPVQSIYGLALDANGRRAFVSDYQSGFRVLDCGQLAQLPPPGDVHNRHVVSFGLALDGKRLVMSRGGAGRNHLECWRISPAGKFKAEWSLLDGKCIDPKEPIYLNSAKWSSHVALSRDGEILVTAESRKGSFANRPLIVVRSAKDGKQLAQLGRSATSFATRLTIAADNKVVFAWDERLVERWDLVRNNCTHKFGVKGKSYFYGLAVHPAGDVVLAAMGDGQVRFLAAADLKEQSAQKLAIGKLHCLAINAKGTQVAAGGDRGKTAIWDLKY